MRRVLIVDDERGIRRILQIMLEELSFESVAVESGTEALECLAERRAFDAVITDLRMPGMDGIELLQRIREMDRSPPVVVLTAHGTVATAVEAMKIGALDFVMKPFDIDTIESVLKRAMKSEIALPRIAPGDGPPVARLAGMVGSSEPMLRVYDTIQRVAAANRPVIITGETGTGKELVARAIHQTSPRRDGPLVAVNCAAIPEPLLESELFGHVRGAFTGAETNREGKFVLADGGTLLLDEIGDMAYPLQAKLLRVLEERKVEPVGSNRLVPVDVRVVSSTNRNLADAVADERFRHDLLYRLDVLQVELPPLRDRKGDIGELARFFLYRCAEELDRGPLTITDGALQLMARYGWPGNVRELRNLVERVAILAASSEVDESLCAMMLPALDGDDMVAPADMELGPVMAEVERKHVLRALAVAQDNKTKAAKLLGVSERTLWYKLKKLKL